MAVRDPNTRDLTQQKLQLAEDLMVWPVRERGELVYRIEIPKLHRFFQVGYEEYLLISLLDGRTTLPQACGLAAARLGDRAPTAAQAGVIGRWLLQNELAYLEADGPPNRRATSRHAGSGAAVAARFLGRLNPFWIKIAVPRSQHWINSCAALLRPLLDMPAVILGMALILTAVIVLLSNWDEFASSSGSLFLPGNWLWLLLSWMVLKIVHELAHAIACHRQSGTVHEAGIVFVLFAPLAYVDVTSCWRMESRWSRIAVAAAGMYVELLIAAAAVLLWATSEAAQTRFLLHNLVLSAGLSTLLFNANVLMRFDGYFILADLIEVANLYSEANLVVRRWAQRIALGQRSPATVLVGWRRHFVLAYGIAAMIWRVAVCTSLTIAASSMFAGAGIAIAALGILLWLGRPLQQLYRLAVDLRHSDPQRLLRGAIVACASVGAAVWLIVCLPVPSAVSVPGVVRYDPESLVRSRVSGLVTQLHVRDGAIVRQGDLLVELENRELSTRLQQLQLTQQQGEIQLRQATDKHDAGLRQVIEENQNALRKQIAQLSQQVEGLRVTAPHSGRIVARGLEAKLGSHVQEGDSILLVAAETDKEIIALIDQHAIAQVRPLVGTSTPIRTASWEVTSGVLQRIEPRADNRLWEPSLAATEGGSLAVRTAEGDEDHEAVRLIEPHFRGRIALPADVAERLPAGIRVRADFGYRREAIAARLSRSIRQLWHQARDEAFTH
jgi:putative peptide zinc metalloprotease protein